MGAPAHSFRITTLQDNDGELRALIEAWEKPSEVDVVSYKLEAVTLTHGECGPLKVVRITDKHSVLCCPLCFLRIKISAGISQVGQLALALPSI